MGSSFNKAIFDDNVSEDLANWAQRARRRNKKNKTNVDAANSSIDERHAWWCGSNDKCMKKHLAMYINGLLASEISWIFA